MRLCLRAQTTGFDADSTCPRPDSNQLRPQSDHFPVRSSCPRPDSTCPRLDSNGFQFKARHPKTKAGHLTTEIIGPGTGSKSLSKRILNIDTFLPCGS